jgi:hypothetical protein
VGLLRIRAGWRDIDKFVWQMKLGVVWWRMGKFLILGQ